MLKKLTLLFLAILWAGVSHAQDPKTTKGEYSLLWEITGKGLKKPSYVFGTMHINDSRVFEFSDSVLIKFDACEGFASEIHPDSLSGGRYSYMYYPDVRIAYADLFKDSTSAAVEALKFEQPYLLRSFYARAAEYDIDKPVFLDAWLFNLAKRQGKVVSELELIEEHVNLVDLQGNAYSTAGGMGGFRFKFDFFGNEDRSNDFIDTYRSGNIKAIDSVMNLSGRSNREFMYHLLDKRNILMAHRIDSLAHHRSTFFAIGAAHLPGKNGVLEILRKKGYKVRRVTATFKGERDNYVPKNNPINWPVIKQDIYGYSVSMPGNVYRGYENQDTFRIHTYIDLGTNTVFQTFCIDYSKHTDKVKGKDLIRKVVISMLESGDRDAKEEFKIYSKKDITQNGVTGQEVIVKGPIYKGFAWRRRSRKSDIDTIWIRMQIFNHQDRVYVNRVYGTQELVNGADANRYFTSAQFYTPAGYKPYKPYTVYNKEGAFIAKFEKPSLRNESVYIENPSDTGSIKRTSYYFMNTNLCNEEDFSLVSYDDYFNSASVDEPDTTLLEYAVKRYADVYYLRDTSLTRIEKDGIPGLEYEEESIYSGNRLKVQVFLRGNRLYSLVYSKEKADSTSLLDMDEFFSSFHFKPLGRSPLQEYHATEDSLSLLMPGVVQHQVDSMKRYYYTGDRTLTRYLTVDPQNGSRYVLRVGHFTPYTCITDPDSIMHREVDYLQIHDDTISEIKDFTCNGLKGKEYIIASKQKVAARYRAVVAGNNYYIWYYRVPLEVGTEDAERFFNSFKLNKDTSTATLAASKSALIFKDLFGTDSLKRTEAQWAVYGYPYDARDIGNLNNALRTIFNKDTDSLTREIAPRILYRSRWHANNETVEILDSLYRSDAVTTREKIIILANLTRLGTDSAMQVFFGLIGIGDFAELRADMEYSEDEENDLEDIYLPFHDSTELFQKYFKELSLLKDEYLRDNFLSATYCMVMADSTHASAGFLEKYKPTFYKWSTQQLAEDKKDHKHDWYSNYGSEAMEYLSAIVSRMSPDKQQAAILTKFTQSSHELAQLWGWFGLLRNKHPYSTSKFKKYMDPAPPNAIWLLVYLEKDSSLNVVPAEYLTQEYIVLSDARDRVRYEVNMNYYDGYHADSITIVKDIVVTRKDKQYRFYLFKIKTGERNYMYGFIGPQPMDKKQYTLKNKIFDTFYSYSSSIKRIEEDAERRIKKKLSEQK